MLPFRSFRKAVFLFLFISPCLYLTSLIGQEHDEKSPFRKNTISLGMAAFSPTDSRFKEIYGTSPLIQIDYSRRLQNTGFSSPSLNFFSGIGYLYGDGKTNYESHTHIHYLPISAGIDCRFYDETNSFAPYLGVGLVGAGSVVHNSLRGPSCLKTTQTGWGWGMRAKSGFGIRMGDHMSWRFFGDYYLTRCKYNYQCKEGRRSHCFVQGVSLGASLVYGF